MPKTNKKFDWEIYDNDDNFIDIITASRDEIKNYLKKHPTYTAQEIDYYGGEEFTR